MTKPNFPKLVGAWSNLPLRAKGFVVVFIPLSALILNFATSLMVDRQREEMRLQVQRTLVVRAKLGEVLTGILNAETGVRGFLLTRQKEFLEPFEAAEQSLPLVTNELFELLRDNPSETKQLLRMQKAAKESLIAQDRLAQVPALDVNMPPSHAARLLESKSLVDAFRREIRAMEEEEGHLLDERTIRMKQVERSRKIVRLCILVYGLLGGIAATGLFSKGIVRRIHCLEENTGRLAGEMPLLPISPGADEIGDLARGVEKASALLAERRRQLHEGAERFRLLVEGVKDYAILMLDPGGRVVSWNSGAQRIKGYLAEEIIGAHFSRFYTPEDLAAGKPEMELKVAADQGSYEEEGWRVHKDGRLFWANVLITAVRDEDGNLRGFSKVTRDITARRRTEEALRASKEEAERANRSKDEFLSRMSHELRTPLNAILGFGQLLEIDDLAPPQAESVELILKAGRHLLGLVNEVLDIASIGAGRLNLSPEPVRVGKLLHTALDLMRPLAQGRRIRLHETFSRCGDLYVLADQQRLRQVFLNLLSNAIKYNHDGGSVTVACEPSTTVDRLTIKVTDTGSGIARQDLSRLFTPFERLGFVGSAVEGTGLGLALSKRLVELMGGKLGAESEPGRGSTFWLELPLAESPVEVHMTSGTAAFIPEPPARDQPCTLLYIEDNLSNLTLIRHILTHRPKMQLLSAMQGSLGLELAHQHQPDLILLDLHLPDLKGDEVLARLRSDPSTARIPVVMISADATPKQIGRLLAAGAHAYLTKPINVPEFLRTVDEFSMQSAK